MDGTCYQDCERKAVHIREIATQMPWFGFRENTLIFSEKSKESPKFYKSLKERDDALKSINFTRVVDSSYGYVFWIEIYIHSSNYILEFIVSMTW